MWERPPAPFRPRLFGKKLGGYVAAAIVLALLLAAGIYYRSRQQTAHRLTEKDTIVLADFSNETGDPVFDDTLKTALSVSLNQSPFLNVLPDNKVAATLKLMTSHPDTNSRPTLPASFASERAARHTLPARSPVWATNTSWD